MTTRLSRIAGAALCLGLAAVTGAQQAAPRAPDRIVVNVDAQQAAEPVSKYEFGMFIEHIGSLIYSSLWSEMLDDRKFYFSINSRKTGGSRTGQGGFPAMRLRKWRPVGPDDVVQMDKDPAVCRRSKSAHRSRRFHAHTASARVGPFRGQAARDISATFFCAAPREPRCKWP